MSVRIICGDAIEKLRELPDESVQCCVTSPPYWGLRDYGVDGQLGLEDTPEEFVDVLVGVLMEVRRVLRSDGTLWLNLGDSYCGAPGGYQGKSGDRASRTFTAKTDKQKRGEGLKPKDLVGIPWRVALALQGAGWWLRSDIIWHKTNPMPESVRDRPTKSHEYLFLLAKSSRYYFDQESVREPVSANWKPSGAPTVKEMGPGVVDGSAKQRRLEYAEAKGANVRSVWPIPTQPFAKAHFATMAPKLAERCILAGCPLGGVVLDPFSGAGTIGLVADRLGRDAILIDLNPEYCEMARARIKGDAPLISEVEVIA